MSVNTTTAPAPESVFAVILAAFDKIGAQYNDAKAASTAINIRRRASLESLAIQIVELDANDSDKILEFVDRICRTPKHPLRTFAKALQGVITKLTEGADAAARV